jgi:hypothetical protein
LIDADGALGTTMTAASNAARLILAAYSVSDVA